MKPLLFIIASTLLSLSIHSQTEWYQVESDTDRNLKCVHFVNSDVGYIGGEQVFLKTANGGVTWTEIAVDSMPINDLEDWYAFDLQFFTEDHGRMMLGEWGGMVETFDGGLTWSSMVPASSGFCQFGSLFFFDASRGFAGGAGCFESAIIDRYENEVWSLTAIPPIFDTNDLVNDMDFLNESNGMAGTRTGRLLRTTDGGMTWDTVPSPELGSSITDIAYFTTDSVYASYARLGGFGTLLSTDGGLTWETDWETATFYYPSMYAVHVSDAGHRYFGGVSGNDQSTGVVFDRTGSTWNYQSVEFAIHDIASHSDTVTFLVGDSGSVYINVNPLLLGMDESDQAITLGVYPNPAQEWINISVNVRAHEVLDVRLFDIQGKEIEVEYTSTDYGIPIQLSDIPKGQYLVEVLTSKGRSMSAFQKQ